MLQWAEPPARACSRLVDSTCVSLVCSTSNGIIKLKLYFVEMSNVVRLSPIDT